MGIKPQVADLFPKKKFPEGEYDKAVEIASKPRIVREPAKSGNIPKEKIVEVIKTVKENPFDKVKEAELQELLKKTEKEKAEEHLKFEQLNGIVLFKLIESNPRLEKYSQLLALFGEILMYRLENKKNKTGFLKATINQITVGIDITEEDLKDA